MALPFAVQTQIIHHLEHKLVGKRTHSNFSHQAEEARTRGDAYDCGGIESSVECGAIETNVFYLVWEICDCLITVRCDSVRCIWFQLCRVHNFFFH